MKGVPGFKGDRLRRAREAMGLSQTSLAAIINVSKQQVSQYEKGTDSPGPEVFDRLRAVLRHEAQYFLMAGLADNAGTKFYRSMASSTKTARLRAEAKQVWIRELLAYLSEHTVLPPVDIPKLSKKPDLISMEEIEIFASEVRQHWGLGESPIANLVEVAESRGAVIVRQELESASLDALSEWIQPENRPLVVLNSEKNVSVRSRLDLAHELGHMVLHDGVTPEALANEETFDLIESQAFRFGAALLLPEKPFLEQLYAVSLEALRALKLKWRVSVAMMIQRLKDLGIIDAADHRKLRIQYSVRKWNKLEPYESEIEIEQPTLFNKCLELMTSRGIKSIDQIAIETGFSAEWIQKLLSIKPKSPTLVTAKVIELKLRA